MSRVESSSMLEIAASSVSNSIEENVSSDSESWVEIEDVPSISISCQLRVVSEVVGCNSAAG